MQLLDANFGFRGSSMCFFQDTGQQVDWLRAVEFCHANFGATLCKYEQWYRAACLAGVGPIGAPEWLAERAPNLGAMVVFGCANDAATEFSALEPVGFATCCIEYPNYAP